MVVQARQRLRTEHGVDEASRRHRCRREICRSSGVASISEGVAGENPLPTSLLRTLGFANHHKHDRRDKCMSVISMKGSKFSTSSIPSIALTANVVSSPRADEEIGEIETSGHSALSVASQDD